MTKAIINKLTDEVWPIVEIEHATVYQFDGDFELDKDEAEQRIAEMFWSMIRETSETPDQAVADMLADEPMMNEAFNNWTDMLCKDGAICDDAYNDLAPDLEDFA